MIRLIATILPFLLSLIFILNYHACSFAQDSPEVGVTKKSGNTIPLDDKFTDSTGHQATIKEFIDGKPAILMSVYYTCPGICNVMLGGMSEAIKKDPLLNPKQTLSKALKLKYLHTKTR